MSAKLSGKRVAFLVTDGFEQVELTGPREALQKNGAVVDILSDKEGTVRGWNHDKPADGFAVDAIFDSAPSTFTMPSYYRVGYKIPSPSA